MGQPAMIRREAVDPRGPRSRAWSIVAWVILVGLLAWSLWFFWAEWFPAHAPMGCPDGGKPGCRPDSTPGWVTGLRWVSWLAALGGAVATFVTARRYVAGTAAVATLRTSLAITCLGLLGLAISLLALP